MVVAVALASACGKTAGRSGGEPAGGTGPLASGGNGDDDTPARGGEGGAVAQPHAGSVATGGVGAEAGVTTGIAGESQAPADHAAVDCDGKSIALDEERVRRCVLLTSCTGGRRSPEQEARLRLGECITNGLTFEDVAVGGEPGFPSPKRPTPWSSDARLGACSGQLETCDDVLACAGFRAPLHECDDNQQARCVGDMAVNCGDEPLLVDCARTTGKAGSCQVLGSGAKAHAACVVKDSCDPGASKAACEGDVAYRCDASGKGVGADCANFGQKCFEAEVRSPACAPPPPPTSNCPGSEFDCQGDSLTFCTEGGKRYAVDCAAGGDFTCFLGFQEPPNSLIYGCHPQGCAEASSLITDDACDGDDVVVGLGDAGFDSIEDPPTSHARVHCPDYGFSTCLGGRCVD